jgi:hypothetical protein
MIGLAVLFSEELEVIGRPNIIPLRRFLICSDLFECITEEYFLMGSLGTSMIGIGDFKYIDQERYFGNRDILSGFILNMNE